MEHKLKTGQVVKLRNDKLFIVVNVNDRIVLADEDGLYDRGFNHDLTCINNDDWSIEKIYHSGKNVNFDQWDMGTNHSLIKFRKVGLDVVDRGICLGWDFKESWMRINDDQSVTSKGWLAFQKMVEEHYNNFGGRSFNEDGLDKEDVDSIKAWVANVNIDKNKESSS